MALSSGTAALHLALLLLGVGPGDEVLTSTLTFAATANAITYVGATPVFIDSDRETWNMDPDLLAEELRGLRAARQAAQGGDRRRSLRPVRRLRADLARSAGAYDVPLIEDAAEALGATYQGRPAGTFGAIGCFSFNGNKIITTSGGGMLVSDREDVARRGPVPGHAGPRSGPALRALADRLQLPHEQPAGGRRPRAACACWTSASSSGGRTSISIAARWATCRASHFMPEHPAAAPRAG